MGDNSDDWEREVDAFVVSMTAANRSHRTVKLRRYYLERLAVAHPAGPWTATPDSLAAFLAVRSWSAETRKSARSTVRVFYRWAAKTGRVPHSPAEGLDAVPVHRGLPHPTPEPTLAAALLGANDRDRLMVTLAARAGLRCAEIARLRWSDIVGGDLRVHGKGDVHRMVPIHAELAPLLAAEAERRRRGEFGTGYRYNRRTSPYLFPGRSGGHVTPETVGKALSDATGMRGHSLRHRFASRIYQETHDLRAVQELLGHSRPETTAIYTKVPNEALRAAVGAA